MVKSGYKKQRIERSSFHNKHIEKKGIPLLWRVSKTVLRRDTGHETSRYFQRRCVYMASPRGVSSFYADSNNAFLFLIYFLVLRWRNLELLWGRSQKMTSLKQNKRHRTMTYCDIYVPKAINCMYSFHTKHCLYRKMLNVEHVSMFIAYNHYQMPSTVILAHIIRVSINSSSYKN